MKCFALFAGLTSGLLLTLAATFAQVPSTVEEKRFAEERNQVIARKLERVFLPGLLQSADDLAKRATEAARAGRTSQAADLFRQARWQLPYVPAELPDHLERVFGNFRLRHSMEVTAAAFRPDGRFLATGSSDRTVKLWDLANGHEVRGYARHEEQVRVVVFSPDGKTIASAGGDANIHLWDAETGDQIRVLSGVGPYTTCLAFSSDGKHLLSGHSAKGGGNGGALAIFDVESGERKRSLSDFRNRVESVAFNKKGNILAVGALDGSVRLYPYPAVAENASEPEYWSQQENTSPVHAVAFSPDDGALLRCGADGIRILTVPQPGQGYQGKAPRRTIPSPAVEEHFTCVTTSADGATLIAGATDGILRMYDLHSGQLISSLPGHAGPIRTVAMHPRGAQIVSAGADCMARLWDFDIVLQSRDHGGHTAPVWSASFSPDGRRVVSASGDTNVILWDVGTPEPAMILKGHTAAATIALFTPDGKQVVSASADRSIKIWDAANGKAVRTLAGHAGTVTSIDVSPDGAKLVSGGADRQVKIWDLASGKEIQSLPQTSVVSAVAFHPDGTRLAVGSIDQTITLYDVAGKSLARWPAHDIAVSGLVFSPDGKKLASCGADGVVHVWLVAVPGEAPITLTGHSGPLSGVAFRKDSQHLVSSGADLSVKLWKLEADSGKELQTYRGHRDWVSSVAFSKEGHHVVSAGVDKLVKIWEITSRDLPVLPEHTGTIDSLAFSPDGKTLATGSSDHTIKLWDRATGAELQTLRGHASNVISLAFTPDGSTLVSAGADRTIKFWDPANGREETRSDTRKQSFNQMVAASPLISISPDGKTLLSWIPGDHRYTTIAGFDLEGNERFTFSDQGRKIHSLCFSADGSRAATGASNGSVRVWDLAKQAPTPGGDWFFFDNNVAVADLALTPDAKTIIVTSDDGDIKIADVATRKILKTFSGHKSRILACVVSGDGRRFATLDGSSLIKIWNRETAEEIRRWDLSALTQDRGGSVLSIAFSPDGRRLAVGCANTTALLLELP